MFINVGFEFCLQPKTKRKKKTGGYDIESELAQCMEILKKDIKEKKFSDKIDYSVLNRLDTTPASTSLTIGVPVDGEVTVSKVTDAEVREVVVEEVKPTIINR